jgi:O-antigen/teichoic acid export membrane protein
MSLKKNLVINAIASTFQKGVRVLNQLFLVPFFISAWGAAYYGEWLTITIIPSVLALADFGLGTAASNSFILKYTSGDIVSASRIIKSGFKAVTGAIIVSILFSTIVLFSIDKLDLLHNSLIDSKSAIEALAILILTNLISFYLHLFEGYYVAARKASLSINLRTFFALANILAGLFVLTKKLGIVEFAISQLLVAVFFNLYYSWKAKKVVTLVKNINSNNEIVKDIFKKGFGYLLSPIWQSIYFQGSTFVVRVVLGPEAVVIFNTVRTATRSINQLFNIVEAATLPEMQFEIGRGEFNNSKKLFRIGIWVSFLIACIGFVFLYFFGLNLYQKWTNQSLIVPVAMWNIFILGLLFNSLWWTTGGTFKAFNLPYQFTIAGVITSIISVIFTYLLSIQYRLIGAAIGNLILDILMTVYILPLSLNLHKMSFTELITDGIKDISDIYSKGLKKMHLKKL